MVSQSKIIFLGAFWFLLLFLPFSLVMTDSQLFPSIDLTGVFAQALYWMTVSGSVPQGIFFIIVILLICFRLLTKKWFIHLFIAVAISQVSGVLIKHSLKKITKEPRPNIVWLAKQHVLDESYFYQLDKKSRQQNLKQILTTNSRLMPLSETIKQHWQHEVNYSFPSGHTLFAISFCLIVSFYLLSAGHILMPLILFGWAMMMGISRMLLGMHWPQDILASTLTGGFLAFITLFVVEYLLPKFNLLR